MELIAASQIPRSTARIVANRPYRRGVERIVVAAALGDPVAAAKLIATPERVDVALVLVITGDRGLSGPYNNGALRAGERLVNELTSRGTRARLFCAGRKSAAFYRFRGVAVEEVFSGFTDRPTFEDARTIAYRLAAPYLSGEAQQILLVSTRYHSAGAQGVEVQQLLPLVVPDVAVDATAGLHGYVEFEPDVDELLASLAPRALESEIFSALLEGAAAFHTSQQRAMAAATDNADDLSQNLTRVMNRARQDSITNEIMEIVGGAEALRSGK